MRNIIYPIIFRYYLIYLLNFSKNKNLIFLKLFCGYEKKILIKKSLIQILKNRFSKKVQKYLYSLFKPLLSLEKFWSFGELRQRVLL